MSIALRAAQGSNNAGGGTTLTMAKPTGTADGDVMVMSLTVRGGTGTTIAIDRDFTAGTITGTSLTVAVYGNGTWVAFGGASGSAAIFTSPDGKTWTNRGLPSGVVNLGVSSGSGAGVVAYGAGLFIGRGIIATSLHHALILSNDGINWTTQPDPFGTTGATSEWIQAVAWKNGIWFLGSNSGSIATSLDNGGTWSTQSVMSAQVFGFEYAQGIYVAIGNVGAVFSSPDAVTWTDHTSTSGTAQSLEVIRFGGGVWVVGGSGGWVATSTDGINFTAVATHPFTDAMNGLDYGNGVFTGSGFASAVQVVATSPNGSTWTSVSAGSVQDGSCVAFGNNLWVLTGDDLSGSARVATRGDWDRLGSELTSGTTLRQGVYRRVASSEPSSFIVTITSAKASGVIISLSGADPATPDTTQYSGQVNASSSTVSAASIGTWAAENGIDLFFGGTATGTTAAAPTNYTEPANGESASTGQGASTRTTSGVAYRALSSTASVGSLTATYGGSAVNIGHHVFIAEAPVPPTPHINPYVQIIR